ncbi:MAG: nucleotidyltransferase domain-containing protein [Acidobacteriota bacterium]
MVTIERERVAKFCKKNDVAQLRIFGSAARGEEDDSSDVDFLVRLSKPKSLLEFLSSFGWKTSWLRALDARLTSLPKGL